MIQVALQWLMFAIVIILFLIYFPTPREPSNEQQIHDDHPHHIPRPSEILNSEYSPPTFRIAVSVTIANAVFFILGAIITVLLLNQNTHNARIWAACLGVASMVLAACQYIPQLWVTWRIKVSPFSIF
jgi:ABC-type branched-subunit amino acid transport system permease subunit